MSEETSKEFFESVLGLGPDWQVSKVTVDEASRELLLDLSLTTSAKVACPECGRACAIYDHGRRREWRHLDTMQLKTVLRARLPRAKCPQHGPQTVRVPWADPMTRFTLAFEAHAIDVLENARSTTQACALLKIGWATADRIMGRAVARGLERRKLEDLRHVGMDEKSFLKGHNYITALNDLDRGRVLEVVQGRTEEAAVELWGKIPEKARATIKAVAMDMWQAFENAARRMVPGAEIVHDKFHISKHLNDGVNRVRTEEHRSLLKEGDDRLKGTRWFWLHSEDNLSDAQYESFRDIKDAALKTSRAWFIKEAFRFFWVVPKSSSEAEEYFREWYRHTIHSKLDPMKKVARMLKAKLGNVVTWWRHPITNAVSEGLNSKIQSIKSAARGFHSFASYRIRILFFCGKLDLKPRLIHSI
ncbi:MAG: ISL3 family transposase [Verrucomicrobiaceae bacterium]|nr:ISL3 family transposase [Verrucomicrobiaceae bacterium]